MSCACCPPGSSRQDEDPDDVSQQEPDALRKKLKREQRARRDAEAIAERVTGELYATTRQLEALNAELGRTNDELQAVNQSMRDFVAIASHDLRGPLTSIIGYGQLLDSQWDALQDDQRLEFLRVIRRQGTHLNALVEDLLTVSKIEAGALDVHAEVVRLHEALRQSISDFAARASEITVDAPMDLAALVDPEHLYRILNNFVTNALKYGKPPVHVRAFDAGEWVEIHVCDNGNGIPLDFVPRLFARFARAEDEVTRSQRGSGLGLSIVQGLAQANGGNTWYEPNQPNGSCFAVRLPKAAA
jgi:signal transduction histidine kinase